MFEAAELGRKLSKKEYERQVPGLRIELLRVQNELRRQSAFSVVIVVSGVDAAGKGETVNRLHEWMDPRFLRAHAFGLPTPEESQRPPMWRFWRVLPPKGRIGVFFGSWYTTPIVHRVYGKTNGAAFATAISRINAFEQELLDAGTLLLKFWFHLSQKEQRKCLKALAEDPQHSWRVTEQDWKNYKHYDDFIVVTERILRETSTGPAPWTIIEGADRRYRELAFARQLAEAIDRRLKEPPAKPVVKPPARAARRGQPTILSSLDLTKRLTPADYAKRIEQAQARLARLSRKADDLSVILVFEGWDAAGKGGAVRRLTGALDARYYRIVPIAAPTDEERAHPYMWRFWRHLPEAGHLTIFDRSWYGRVLVERVEGFASKEEWARAYKEINEFESQLIEHGIALGKFWLHLDKREQAKRFAEREKIPYKRYKITAEDYRNRKKWDLYEDAVNEMVERTSTSIAPWTLIEANDKRYARARVLEVCCDIYEAALEGRGGKGR